MIKFKNFEGAERECTPQQWAHFFSRVPGNVLIEPAPAPETTPAPAGCEKCGKRRKK